jgi:hypothetical protein
VPTSVLYTASIQTTVTSLLLLNNLLIHVHTKKKKEEEIRAGGEAQVAKELACIQVVCPSPALPLGNEPALLYPHGHGVALNPGGSGSLGPDTSQ